LGFKSDGRRILSQAVRDCQNKVKTRLGPQCQIEGQSGKAKFGRLHFSIWLRRKQSGNLGKQSGQITVAWLFFGTLQQFWVVAQASSI
jgi:hypothetical protein